MPSTKFRPIISIGQLLLLVLPALIMLFLIASLALQSHKQEVYSDLNRKGDSLALVRGEISQVINLVSRQLLYLTEENVLLKALSDPSRENKQEVASQWQSFLLHQARFDQIRWIDNDGMEQIRVNYNSGAPSAVDEAGLQDKSGRYYFKHSIDLDHGQIYLSPLDLNIENGRVEQPLKPVMRLATPVFDQDGQRNGVLILNYLGKPMLERLRQASRNAWLVNERGFWLLGTNDEDEWGWQQDRLHQNLKHRYPGVWTFISQDDSGTIETDSGYWQFETLRPLEYVSENTTIYPDYPTFDWKLIHFTPSSQYLHRVTDYFNRILAITLIVGVVFVIMLIAFYRSRKSELLALDLARQAQKEARTVFESSPDPMLAVDEGGSVIRVNKSAANFFGYSRKQLVSMKVEQLMPDHFRKAHLQHRANFQKNPHPRLMENGISQKAQLANGELRDVSITLDFFKQLDGETLYTALIRDVTRENQAKAELEQSRERLSLATEAANLGVWEYDSKNDELYWDQRMLEIYGVDSISNYQSWLQLIDEQDRQAIALLFEEFTEHRQTYNQIFRIRRPDGQLRSIQTYVLVSQAEDRDYKLIGINRDVTEQVNAENLLRDSEKQFRFLLDNSPIAVRIATRTSHTVVYANPAYAELMNDDLQALVNHPLRQNYASDQDYQEILTALEQGVTISERLLSLNIPGIGKRWTMASFLPMVYLEQDAVLAWYSDITELKNYQDELEHQAKNDSLTGLPNRTLFADRLQLAMHQSLRRATCMVLVFIDLDGFKQINDSFGHEAGDFLLKTLAGRMSQTLRDSDTLARYGGDEFVMILTDLDNVNRCKPLLDRVLKASNRPVEFEGKQLQVSASMGLTTFPQNREVSPEELVLQADQAMYEAKQRGKDGYALYSTPEGSTIDCAFSEDE